MENIGNISLSIAFVIAVVLANVVTSLSQLKILILRYRDKKNFNQNLEISDFLSWLTIIRAGVFFGTVMLFWMKYRRFFLLCFLFATEATLLFDRRYIDNLYYNIEISNENTIYRQYLSGLLTEINDSIINVTSILLIVALIEGIIFVC